MTSSTTTILGYPPIGSFHWTVYRSCEPGTIYSPSINLRHRLIIEGFTHRVESVLSVNQTRSPAMANQSDFYPLIHMLEQDLEAIGTRLQPEMNGEFLIRSITV